MMRKILFLILGFTNLALAQSECQNDFDQMPAVRMEKENTYPGAIVRVRKQVKGAILGENFLEVPWPSGAEMNGLWGIGWGLPPGFELEVVHGPKKIDGINVVTVLFTRPDADPKIKVEAEIQWNAFKQGVELIRPGTPLPPKAPRQAHLKFPNSFSAENILPGNSAYGRPNGNLGDVVWTGVGTRQVSPGTVGIITSTETEFGDVYAHIQLANGKSTEVLVSDTSILTADEIAEFRAWYGDKIKIDL
jgi:hypothetical protein